MNSVQIIGNLTRDPMVRATKAGRAVASFTVGVNRNYITPQGEQKEITDWITVVAWGNLAEAVGNRLKKGTRVFVEGRYTTRSYDDQTGQRRWVTEVTANMVAVPLDTYSNQQTQGGYGNRGGFDNPTPAYGGNAPQPPAGNFNNASPAGNAGGATPAERVEQFRSAFPVSTKQGNAFPGREEEIPF